MQSLFLQNQPIMAQDNYQPHPGVSPVLNDIFGSEVMMNQHQQYLQISVFANNLPMADLDAGQHDDQLLKISVPDAGAQTVSQTTQAESSTTKIIASTTPTSVITSVAVPVSAASANPAVVSLTKTRALPKSETPKISATIESDQQIAMKKKMVQKCCFFFKNLLADSSTTQQDNTGNFKSNLTELIQDVIDDKIEVEEFVDKLERMSNSGRQPLLANFLTKSLPLLRTSLHLNQMTIKGIKPPPPKVALATLQLAPTSVKQRSLIKPKEKVKSKSSPVTKTNSRPRAIQPSGLVMLPRATVTAATSSGRVIMPPATVAKPQTTLEMPPATVATSSGRVIMYPATAATPPTTMAMPLRATMSSASFMTSPTTVTMAPATTQVKTYPTSSKWLRPTKKLVHTDNLKSISVVGKKSTNIIGRQSPLMTNLNIHRLPDISNPVIQRCNVTIGENKKNVSSIETNEELNDVMTMGGIDIIEETKEILSSTDKIGTEVRSCKEKLFLNATALQHKIKQMLLKHGLEGAESDVLALVSQATEQRIRGVVEKLSIASEHRLDFNRKDPRYQVTQDVRSQLRFLQEVDQAASQKQEAEELALLLQASKSKSKDEEQIKLKVKAKEAQKVEMEKLQKRDADLAALQALGPRKKPKLDLGMTSSAAFGLSTQPFRPRIKKICMKDLLFVLQEEQSSCRSTLLYKSYLK